MLCSVIRKVTVKKQPQPAPVQGYTATEVLQILGNVLIFFFIIRFMKKATEESGMYSLIVYFKAHAVHVSHSVWVTACSGGSD